MLEVSDSKCIGILILLICVYVHKAAGRKWAAALKA